jgi:hypothetical protein
MADPEGQDLGGDGFGFAAPHNHDERCSRPPRVRNTDNPGLYHGYFEKSLLQIHEGADGSSRVPLS